MSKIMTILCLAVLASCATQRGPASIDGNPVAYDSMALGNVKASAVKRADDKDVCFDIKLLAKDIKPEQAQVSNWTLSWIDQNNQTHPLPITHREPASAPQGGAVVAPYGSYTDYSNNFTTCVPKTQFENVKGIVLTPKDLPYVKNDLKLNWNN